VDITATAEATLSSSVSVGLVEPADVDITARDEHRLAGSVTVGISRVANVDISVTDELTFAGSVTFIISQFSLTTRIARPLFSVSFVVAEIKTERSGLATRD